VTASADFVVERRVLLQPAIGSLVRLIAGAALSIWLVVTYGPRLAESFLPVLQWVFVQLDSVDRVIDLSITDRGAVGGRDLVYRLIVAPEKMVFVGEHLASGNPQGSATISVLVAYLWQSFVIALPMALAWPVSRRIEWALRLMCLMAVLAGFTLIDLPFTLWAQVWQTYVDAFAPGKFSLLLVWAQFLQGGGRFVLGIVAAGISVYLARYVCGIIWRFIENRHSIQSNRLRH
jgi:hypothetical protein